MKIPKLVINLALTLTLFGLPFAVAINAQESKPKIQIAILLDSSNSMDGLIDQTRSQIWKVVNVLTDVTKNGKTPVLEVALYHYGNDGLIGSEGFVQRLSPFTTELDVISEKLFSIQTYGGLEYAGWVIQSAMRQLNWSDNPEDFRVIFIAGNEPFDQGEVPWREAIAKSVAKDTLVNTIYCGDAESEERSLWSQGATLAKGSSFNINQDRAVAWIPSPYDQEIIDWNNKLNATYIPYGEEGAIGQQRQLEADANAGEQLVVRGASKVSNYYRNSSWDLVDALEAEGGNLAAFEEEALPEPMRNMTLTEREKYIESVRNEREEIQGKIRDLYRQRDEYIAKKAPDSSPKDTLDYVMIQALREQLAAKGFNLTYRR